MEPFEIAYDDATQTWVKRPLTERVPEHEEGPRWCLLLTVLTIQTLFAWFVLFRT